MNERMRKPMPMRLKSKRRAFIFVSRVPSAMASLGVTLEASLAGPIEERTEANTPMANPTIKTVGEMMRCSALTRI